MKALLIIALLCGVARAQPADSTLIYAGIGMAPIDYIAGTALHEGSHALMAKLIGADVDELHVFPPGRDPHAHVFRWGWTYVHGIKDNADMVAFLIAPKVTDVLLLGGFALFAYTNRWPHDKYGQLALTVVGTGLWVDFAKDVVLFAPQNDVSKIFKLWHITGWEQLPARLVYAAMDVGFGLVVAHGYTRLFDRNDPVIVPVTRLAF